MKKSIFTSERVVLFVILINSVILFLQESGIRSPLIDAVDILCSLFFVAEMAVKHCRLGVRKYWASWWNRLDGTLVILSIPALVSYFIPAHLLDLSVLMILRVLRVFRLFRIAHIFPNFGSTIRGLGKALKDSLPIFIAFLILIVIVALFSCALFKDVAPQYFATPWDSIYSTFRLCTVEGWYEIPDALAPSLTGGQIIWVRVYFVFILVIGGIIGLSLVNSIFVDAMLSDNNDELESQVRELNDKISSLTEEVRKLNR